MKNIALALIALACIAASVFFLYHDKNEWGWFLFAAILCVMHVGDDRDA